MSEKRFYWLKLKDDFFGSLRIKKLRKLAGGDTYTIIYLKLQLLAIKDEGMVRWKGVEDNVVDELALELDEEPENVSVTLQYLLSTGLAETADNKDFFFPWAIANTGSETATAQRMRDCRARKLCNQVTPALQERYTEIDIEKDKDLELDKESEIEKTASPPVSPPQNKEVEEMLKRVRESCRRLGIERN